MTLAPGLTGSQEVPHMKKIQHFLPHCSIRLEHAKCDGSRRTESASNG